MGKKKKIFIIVLTIVVAVLVVGGIGYVCYNKYQQKIELQKQEQKQELEKWVKENYENSNSQIEELILNEEEQNEINAEIEKVKVALENGDITENTKEIVQVIMQKIQQMQQSNITILENKEKELNEIDVSKFNEEQNKKVQELQNTYTELKENGKYKEAQAKIDEIIEYKNKP